MEDEGVSAMHELNAITEYHEVEQETRGGVLLVLGGGGSFTRKRRERETTNVCLQVTWVFMLV